MERNTLRKNPSRETCENTIKRILMTEVLEHGTNTHFRSASDFMNYFESLFPASDALTKQVQRAVKALDMPKDEKGFYIVNKTVSQLDQENEIKHSFDLADARAVDLDSLEMVFLHCLPHMQDRVIYLLSGSQTFEGKFVTIVKTFNGLLIYTQNKKQLMILLNSLTI